MKYLDVKGIKEAFAMHLIKYRGYTRSEAFEAVSDFPDPYNLPYLDEEFLEGVTIDGIDYEKNASAVRLWKCGIDDVPMFCFYTYYACNDVPDQTVRQYRKARKLFQIEDLNMDDFPSDNNMY